MNKITRDDTDHGVEYVRADEAQAEIERLNYEVDAIPAIKEERDALAAEVLEQCRIIAMGAEREDALRAELTRLKASIALDKMAENARDLGLSYDPTHDTVDIADIIAGELKVSRGTAYDMMREALAEQQEPVAWQAMVEDEALKEFPIKDMAHDWCVQQKLAGSAYSYWIRPLYTTPLAAQPAVQEGRDWSLLEATQESLREHMAEIKRLKAAQPAPVQDLPFGVGGGLVAIKTLLGRDPCVHANTAIEMIDAMLAAEPQPVPVKTYHNGKPWPVAPAPDPAPIIQQLVTALEGSGTRMRSDQWYVEIEAVAAGKFYLNSKGEGL
jgi:hypothetical protein